MARAVRRDEVEVILACREARCAWDYLGTGWYITFDRYGRRVWERVAPCLRGCGSTQKQRQEPWLGGRRLSSKVEHTPAWYEFKGYYFTEARIERIQRQIAASPVQGGLETVYPIGFKGEKPREEEAS